MEPSYLVKAFTNMVNTKLVLNANEKLKENGFTDVEVTYSVKVRENRYFQTTVTCGDYTFVVPEFDLYEDIVNDDIDKSIQDYVEDFGSFVAHEYTEFMKQKQERLDHES